MEADQMQPRTGNQHGESWREAGDNYLPHALATLVCEGGRRTNFWRGELIAALKLVDVV